MNITNQSTYPVLYAGICGSDLQKTNPRSTSDALQGLGHEIVVTTPQGPAVVNPMISCKVCAACTSGSEMLCESLQAIGRTSAGAFSGKVTAPLENLIPIRTSETIVGVLADPLAVVIHGMQKIKNAKHILILGDGIIAQLTLLFNVLNNTGSSYTLVAKTAKRASSLKKQFETILADNPAKVNVVHAIKSGEQYDTIIECVGRGQSEMLNLAINAAAPSGTILSFGVYPVGYTADLEIRTLLYKEVRLIGSNSYNHADLMQATRHLEQHEAAFSVFIGKTYTNLEEAFGAAHSKTTIAPKKIVVKFEEVS